MTRGLTNALLLRPTQLKDDKDYKRRMFLSRDQERTEKALQRDNCLLIVL
jgi:hypothetical protein